MTLEIHSDGFAPDQEQALARLLLRLETGHGIVAVAAQATAEGDAGGAASNGPLPPLPDPAAGVELPPGVETTRTAAVALDDFAASGDVVVLLMDSPRRCPEAWDLAVVLPELLAAWAPDMRAGVADPGESAAIAARHGIARFPALLFLRDGGHVGALEGMRDWSGFAAGFARMRETPVSRAPGIGIAVRGAAATTACGGGVQ